LSAFVDSLSNWYVRRNRDRFWSSSKDTNPEVVQSKNDAYWTLFECLITTAKLIAPFTPFLAERIWQQLTSGNKNLLTSVHLCDYPTANEALINTVLSETITLEREIVSLGRNARMNAKLKVRQPLARIEVIFSNPEHYKLFAKDGTNDESVASRFEEIKEELNVKAIGVTNEATKFVSYNVLPNLKKLGSRLGKKLPLLKTELSKIDGTTLVSEMSKSGKVTLKIEGEPVELTGDDIQIRLTAKEGWAAADSAVGVVVLATELTPELISEGYAREVVRMIQNRRKEIGCEYTDRIVVGIETSSQVIVEAVKRFQNYIAHETLANKVTLEKIKTAEPVTLKADNEELVLYVGR
jgi:isoleucyl-tRNA synthetase